MAGILSGLIGIGGGIIIVPALLFLFGLSQHQAQGTTLALMAPPISLDLLPARLRGLENCYFCMYRLFLWWSDRRQDGHGFPGHRFGKNIWRYLNADWNQNDFLPLKSPQFANPLTGRKGSRFSKLEVMVIRFWEYS
jgi:hypothetical protein